MIIGDRHEDGPGKHSPSEGKAAPEPAVHTRPPEPVHPRTWDIPHHGSHARELTVHRDVLRQVGGAMLGRDMEELDEAVRRLRHAVQEFGSLQGWSTGTGFTSNVATAREGFITATGQAGQVHGSAAKKLMDTAGSYDEAEAKSQHHHLKNGHYGG